MTADGRSKKAYPTFSTADAFARLYGQVAYECGLCGLWHCGGDRFAGSDRAR